MSHLSPRPLTADELQALLRVTADHPRDHVIFSLALGTGLRVGEIVGLVVGGLFFPDGRPRLRVRVRAEIAKRGRAATASCRMHWNPSSPPSGTRASPLLTDTSV